MAVIDEIESVFSKFESYKLKINQDNFLLNFKYMGYDYTINIDKDKEYIYIESGGTNFDRVNVNLLYEKNLKNVPKLISNSLKNESYEIETNKDLFGIFRERTIFNKAKLDYQKLIEDLNDSTLKSDFTLSSIPSNMLYSRKQIVNMIVNEIKKVNSNKDHDHYVSKGKEDYNFEITLFFRHNLSLKLEIKYDPDLHPFYPPKLKLLSTNVKQGLMYNISNLEILKLENWNPIIDLDWLLYNLVLKMHHYIDDYVLVGEDKEDIDKLDILLVDLALENGEKLYTEIKIDIKHSKFSINDTSSKTENKYWKSGVGYGYKGRSDWDIKSFIQEQINKTNNSIEILRSITNIIDLHDPTCIEKVTSSMLMNYLRSNVCNTTLLDINNKIEFFIVVLDLIRTIFKFIGESFDDWKIAIHEGLEILRQDVSPLLNNLEDDEKISFYIRIIAIADDIKEHVDTTGISVKKESSNSEENKSLIDQYKKMIKQEQDNILSDYTIKDSHRFFKNKTEDITPKSIMRISSEFSSMRNNLPNDWDTSIIVRGSTSNINIFSFVITGPKDTPYHNGIFEFHAYFPKNYPDYEPKVLLDTTGGGTVRFNPNLYDCGKVCLSLLGTWQGDQGEAWNKQTSTFLQVLVSIQSLILVEQPYFNEPGWERDMNTKQGDEKSFNYNDNIRYYTLRWAIIDKFENPPYGFEEFTRQHFEMKKEELLETTKLWVSQSKKYKDKMQSLWNKLYSLYYPDFKSDEKLDDDYFEAKYSKLDSESDESNNSLEEMEIDSESESQPK